MFRALYLMTKVTSLSALIYKNTEYHDIFKVLSGLNNLAERLEHLG